MAQKILIVDDETSVRELMYDFLKREGYKVLTAPGGAEALELIRVQKPDLAVIDFRMPGMNGLELINKVRSFDPYMKIVMLTGQGTEELEKKALLSGAVGFLHKSLGVDVIVTAIREILRERKMEEESKILVVESDPKENSQISSFLEKKGFNVIGALDGEEALERVEKDKPVLIIMSLNLLGMDGMLVLKRIRAGNDKVRVIMISDTDDREVYEEAANMGVCAYMGKPLDMEYLSASVQIQMGILTVLSD